MWPHTCNSVTSLLVWARSGLPRLNIHHMRKVLSISIYSVCVPNSCLSLHTLQISYGSTDPATDDREQYPLLSTTIPTELFLNLGRLELLRMFNWFRIGVLSSVDDSYNTVRIMRPWARINGIYIIYTIQVF